MGTCFVIQPFDKGGFFDKRFNETIEPAINETGLKAYRVDNDPKVSIIIESIEDNIDNSEAVLVDISEDNPNVWFELGMAIKSKKNVILICSANRDDKFPFDIQHRKIIKYNTQSQSDFDKLKTEIKDCIKAILDKKTTLNKLPYQQLIADTKGLAQHEIIILVSIAENLKHTDDDVSYLTIKEDAERQGLTPIAISIGLNSLLKKDMIEHMQIPNSDNMGNFNGEYYDAYKSKPTGWAWLEENQSKLVINVSDDDMPF